MSFYKGVDPCPRDNNGVTPLTFAATQTPPLTCYLESFQVILEWVGQHWAKVSAEELYEELLKA
jgi:hypothetical protein